MDPLRKLEMHELNRKSAEAFQAAEKMPVQVVLDNVRSMHNVGSIFRTADAFLLEGICLCGYTPRPPHRDIHKTALGATETVNWRYFADTPEALAELKREGYRIWAVEQTANSLPLQQFRWNETERIALVFGNEVTGVGGDALALCQGCLEIPQAGTKHSLNISIAAGIVLWEIFRQTPWSAAMAR